MAKLEEVHRVLEALKSFLTPAIPFVNSHLNSFFMESLWEKHLSEGLKNDLDAMSIADLKNTFKTLAHQNASEHLDDGLDRKVDFTKASFQEIVSFIGQLLVACKHLSVQVEDFKLSTKSHPVEVKSHEDSANEEAASQIQVESHFSKWNGWKFDPFMSPKKMHEVEVMSEFIAKVADLRLSSTNDPAQRQPLHDPRTRSEKSVGKFLIDVGSGKGYLSSFLALLYSFNVLALDSSSVNTYGCTKRSSTLQKNWSSFLRRASDRQSEQDTGISKRGKHWKSKRGENPIEKASEAEIISQSTLMTNKADDCECENPIVTTMGGEKMATVAAEDASLTTTTTRTNVDEKLKSVTLFVNDQLDLLQLLHDNFRKEFPHDETPPLGIIGLHTCGQLGVDSIKLFCNSKHAEFLVNVPCCYHLLNEEFHRNEEDFAGRKYIPCFEDDTPGFPLCQNLHTESFYLGRNARMMSAQSIHRMSVEEDEMDIPRPLLYRALLQVLIRRKLGHTALETSVGRLGSKFTDFNQYVQKAWTKLKLSDVPVPPEEIEVLYRSEGAQRERFHKYFLLRALFAPLIERCILLDRLAYLLEQGDVHEAFIVELFDPFLSPRCHALVAVR